MHILSNKLISDELRLFITSIKRINYKFSAICIQESWLSKDNDTSQIQLKGYISLYYTGYVV